MTNGEKHIEKLLSWYKEAVTEDGVCYLTSDDKNTLAYALKCCKHFEDIKKDIDTWMLRNNPGSSKKPNRSEIQTGSTTKNGTSNRTIIYKAKDSKDIQEDLEKLEKLNEPTTKNCESCEHYGLYHEICNYCYKCSLWIEKEHNLCYSCINIGCEFQSGIVRTECAFYMPPHIEPDNCGNYVVQDSTTKNDLGIDAVSRKAVINQIFYSTDNSGDVVLGSALRERIEKLPSVTPQEPIRPKGKWISHHCGAYYECSNCHERNNSRYDKYCKGKKES